MKRPFVLKKRNVFTYCILLLYQRGMWVELFVGFFWHFCFCLQSRICCEKQGLKLSHAVNILMLSTRKQQENVHFGYRNSHICSKNKPWAFQCVKCSPVCSLFHQKLILFPHNNNKKTQISTYSADKCWQMSRAFKHSKVQVRGYLLNTAQRRGGFVKHKHLTFQLQIFFLSLPPDEFS